MILHVSVTHEDINLGVRCDENECPVALATMRALTERLHRQVGWIAVGGTSIEFDLDTYKDGPPDVSVRTPEEVASRIGIYDDNDHMAPFEFDLDIPNLVIPPIPMKS